MKSSLRHGFRLAGLALVLCSGWGAERNMVELIQSLSDPAKAVEAAPQLMNLTAVDVPQLIVALRTPDSPLEEKLRNIGERTGFLSQNRFDSAFIRATAAYLLGQMREEAAEAVPALIERLNDADADVRRKALRALGKIGPPAVSALKATLADNDPRIRANAAKGLGQIGAPAKDAVGQLTTLLFDRHTEVRLDAYFALGAIGEKASPAVPSLLLALRDRRPEIRRLALKTLGQIGVRTVEIRSALLAGLQDPDGDVRYQAAYGLGNVLFCSPESVTALISATADGNRDVSTAARNSLLRYGSSAVPHLMALFPKSTGELQNNISDCLAEIAAAQGPKRAARGGSSPP